MEFQGRYQILELLNDGEAKTFRARQTSSGRAVLVHQLWTERTPPNQPDLASMFSSFLRRATAEEMKVLIDMGEDAGRVFVVTQDLPIFLDLRQWLQSESVARQAAPRPSTPKPAPSVAPAPAKPAVRLSPEASRESVTSLEATQAVITPKVFAPPTPPPPKAKEEAGEFTKVFFGKEMTKPPAPAPAPKAKEEAGEFTRVFFGKEMPAPAAPAPPAPEKPTAPPVAPPPAPKAKEEGGEFTKVFFGKDMPAPVAPAPPAPEKLTAPPVAPPPAPKAKEEGGEFTRVFFGKEMPAPPVHLQPEKLLRPPLRRHRHRKRRKRGANSPGFSSAARRCPRLPPSQGARPPRSLTSPVHHRDRESSPRSFGLIA